MACRASGVLVVALLLVGGAPGPAPSAAAADAPSHAADLRAAEAKALLPLLKAAVKGDHRRQAWWLATRILVAEPGCGEAEGALRTWKDKDFQGGEDPTKSFLEKRDAALKKLGDAYAATVRSMQAAGAKPQETWALVERALAYGNRDADVTAALASAEQTWCGGWGTQAKEAVDAALGAAAPSVEFVAEHDEALLRVKPLWPDAKAVRVGSLRLVTGVPAAEAWKLVTTLSALEAHFVAAFGSRTRPERDPEVEVRRTPTLVVVPDVETYDRLAEALFAPPPDRADPRYDPTPELKASSRWYDPRRRLGLVLWGHRDNPWLRPETSLLGLAAATLARKHLATSGWGWLPGPGGWVLLDGLGGVYEGFVPTGPLAGDVDPAKAWKLAVARAEKDRGGLAKWDDVVALDTQRLRDEPRADLKLTFDGKPQDAKRTLLPAAQATALVWGIWRHDAKGCKKLADLLEEAFKRDRLPDLDKGLGARPGSAYRWAEEAIDAWPGK
ncbi:MAG: hypothetical protein IT460_17400 [Planctomycetes bacterium]|nr:hypothetical protein [Planctomycetota bacterium]